MRLCRFDRDRLGVVQDSTIHDVTAALDALPSYRYPLPQGDPLVTHLAAVMARVRTLLPAAPTLPLAGARLLSPVANPGKIVAAPVNYQDHFAEVLAQPELHHENAISSIHKAGLFLKATSSVVGPGEGVALRKLDRRNDHEVELAVVIGREASAVPRARALDYVAGYAVALDITIRGPEERSFRKSPDTYTVLGLWLVTADEVPDPGALDLRLSVNGAPRQHSNTSRLILGVPELIELASSFYTLYPGDVIITGTPEGVGPIQPGDVVSASVERVGEMDVLVREWTGREVGGH